MPLFREPAPALRPYVRGLYGFREDTGARTRRREGPGAEAVVLLSFGTEWRIGDATDAAIPIQRVSSFAAGLRTTSVLTEHDGHAYGMQISLTPPGAYAVLGVPMHELESATVPLESLLGADGSLLVERVLGEEDWQRRFDVLEAALASRLEAARLPTPGVAWAWRRLEETHGSIPVGALREELGWSPKRLLRRFRDEVGLAPKSLARVLRFERAAALLERSDRPSLAHVAATCGYYDQSHLTGELRRITGVTPAAYAAGSTFFQDDGPAHA